MNLYTHQDENIRKTWILMTGFLVFVIALGWLFSQALESQAILYGGVVLSILMNITSYWYSDKIALAMSRARRVTREDNVRLHRIVENLAITAGLPKPPVYIIPGQQINAFATGRDPQHAAVAVTEGALERLDDNELEGVIGHELSHIGNRDILVSTVIVVLAGLVSIMSDWFLRITWHGRSNDDNRSKNGVILLIAFVAALLAPLAATLIQLSVSRKREFLADASGALLTRYPEGLARALEKIALDGSQLPVARTATAHLFLANPFKADVPTRGQESAPRPERRGDYKVSWLAKLFMTHPPVEERIRALRGMET